MNLRNQIRQHYRSLDESQEPILWDELVERVEEAATIDLVPRRPSYRRWATVGAAAFAVMVIGVVATLTGPPTPVSSDSTVTPTSLDQPPNTIPDSLENTLIQLPDDVPIVAGVAEHRGGPARNGVVDAEGPMGVDGYYWRFDTNSEPIGAQVAWGQNLFVSTTRALYALNMTTGELAWPPITLDGFTSTPSFGVADFGEGPVEAILAIVDGATVKVFRVDTGDLLWFAPILVPAQSSPVIADGVLYVVNGDGYVYAFDTASGQPFWTYPLNPEDPTGGLGLVVADLAYQDGFLYVGAEEGVLHVLDVSLQDALHVCDVSVGDSIVVPPIFADGAVYAATMGQQIFTFQPGTCIGPAPDRDPFYFAEAEVDVSPVVVDDLIYIPAGRFLNARRLSTSATAGLSGDDLFLWPPGSVAGEVKITGAPVLAGETIYFGDQEGILYAVDRTTGQELWRWNTGAAIRAAPAVVDGVVFVASEDGNVYAVGQGQPVGGE